MAETFIIRKEWLNNIENLPLDQQDKILADIVRFGAEVALEHEDDAVVSSMVNFVKRSITAANADYASKCAAGKMGGRPKKVDDVKVYQLAREGKTSKQISEELEVSKSSVDHSDGWLNRKNQEWLLQQEFEF